jgi:signal transduction histidine kinase/CheY-like chemotaxis protein
MRLHRLQRRIQRKRRQKANHDNPNSLSARFEEDRIRIMARSVSIGSILAATLVPLFGLLDLVFKGNVLGTFIIIRIGVTLASFTMYFLLKTPYGKSHPYPLGAILTFIVGGAIALMTHLDLGPADPYYAGINLPLLGFGILLPLTLKEGSLIFILVWLTYFIPNVCMLTPETVKIFISNNFFMLSTIIIALASSQFHLYHRKKQFYTLQRLEVAHRKIKNHAADLEKKVQERTERLLQSERLAVVGQLAGGVAHDFNNFLTAIMGITELLLHTIPEDDPREEDLKSISRVGGRAAELVKQLLAFSRRQIMMPQNINLNEIIQDLQKMLSRVIGEHIELTVHPDPNLGYVLADPAQMEQIILNLCVNARDAMPDGGKLIIETSNTFLDHLYCKRKQTSIQAGEYVMLAISDTGMGMDDNVKSKIFEPFFTTKQEGEGTGLGLSSVYGIIQQSNGDILVYSEIGKGTVFKIYLPRIEKPQTDESDESDEARDIPKGKETILLVEDEDEVRDMTARMLQNQGYQVLTAREGREALTVSRNHRGHIDLLLTDVVMPHMNGKLLAEHLSLQRHDLKVLFLSGYTPNMMIHQGILNGSAAFLQKPYTMESLSHKIRQIFDN